MSASNNKWTKELAETFTSNIFAEKHMELLTVVIKTNLESEKSGSGYDISGH
jgi:hypothetical protein